MSILDYFKKKIKPLSEAQDPKCIENDNDQIIRLYYVYLERFNTNSSEATKLAQTYGISTPFRLPKDMSMDDACRVVSYLSEKVERENNIEPGCENSVSLVVSVLSDYGFEKINEKGEHTHIHIVSEFSPFYFYIIKANISLCLF